VNLSCKVHRDGKIAQNETFGPLGFCSCSCSYFGCGCDCLNSFSKNSRLLPQLISKTTSTKTNTTGHCFLLSTLQPHPISSYKPIQSIPLTSPSKYKNQNSNCIEHGISTINPSHINYITGCTQHPSWSHSS
jgi:hypothetical protein